VQTTSNNNLPGTGPGKPNPIMKTTQGDLILLAQKGHFDVIVHGCNCFNTMGAGIAKAIRDNFPAAFIADQQTARGDKSKLGTITIAETDIAEGRLTIVNGYTQYAYGRKGQKVDYEALRQVFKRVKEVFSGQRIGYPAIGAGLAGGDWQTIARIIDEELNGEDHTYVEFE
jgi:O-acetyl-ADP-ribose deacetylase (regulator of RNase III)